MTKKEYPLSPEINKEIDHFLKSINEKRINKHLEKIIAKIKKTENPKKQDLYTGHLFSIFRKILYMKLTEGLIHSISKLINEKEGERKKKEIKTFTEFLMALESGISEVGESGMKMEREEGDEGEENKKQDEAEDEGEVILPYFYRHTFTTIFCRFSNTIGAT